VCVYIYIYIYEEAKVFVKSLAPNSMGEGIKKLWDDATLYRKCNKIAQIIINFSLEII